MLEVAQSGPVLPSSNRLRSRVPGGWAHFQRVNATWLTLFRQVELFWTAGQRGPASEKPQPDIKAFIFFMLDYTRQPINSSGRWYLPCFSTDDISLPLRMGVFRKVTSVCG